jgi:hypothetical protein
LNGWVRDGDEIDRAASLALIAELAHMVRSALKK